MQQQQIFKKQMLAVNTNSYVLGELTNVPEKQIHSYFRNGSEIDENTQQKLGKALEFLYWRTKSEMEDAFKCTLN